MDSWYGMGSGEMLEVVHTGMHVAQMTSQKGIRQSFDAVTTNAAKVMHLEGYGIAPGCDASFGLLQARDVVEAIRLRANRLQVWEKGQLLAITPEVKATLLLPKRSGTTGFMSYGQVLPLLRRPLLIPSPEKAGSAPPAFRPGPPAICPWFSSRVPDPHLWRAHA